MCQTPTAKKMKMRVKGLGKIYYPWLRNYIVKTKQKHDWCPLVSIRGYHFVVLMFFPTTNG